MRRPRRQLAGYLLILAASFLVAMAAGFTALGRQVDADAYDFIFRLRGSPVYTPESALVAIDEASLLEYRGIRGIREMLADALERLSAVSPRVVAVDLTLAEAGDPDEDRRLEAAMRRTRNLVLAAEMLPRGEGWQDPLPPFRRWAAAVGHVHAAPDELDGVDREIPLEKVAGRQRRWALAIEAYRLSRGVAQIVESPQDLQVGRTVVPARRADARAVFVRYLPVGPDGSTPIPRVSIKQLRTDPRAVDLFRNRTVFLGVTAQSAARDKLMTPYGSDRWMPGVEVHANVFETLARGRFLVPAGNLEVVGVCAALVALAGLIFALLSGWTAYALGGVLLAAAHVLPYMLFAQGIVFPSTAPVLATWLAVAGAASYQHFVARRQLRRAEAETARYQQAVHFVTHELRTPLTAIQGSSELMSRYNMTDQKRKQIADLIHSESQRLARMIETFLNVERLSAGQMELKREPVPVAEIVGVCLERARVLADRKQISLHYEPIEGATLIGDRELLEYAFYNLLTNAVKYSPVGTEVAVTVRLGGDCLRLAVSDQGIGMDKKELRNIFRKFYRTQKAVASGEVGTGIGLSIVEQIVTHHGGKIEVASAPGKGSCFTLILPVAVSAGASDG